MNFHFLKWAVSTLCSNTIFSGIWCDNFQDIYYLCIQFPDPASRLVVCTSFLCAAVHDEYVVAFDWRFADFLYQQGSVSWKIAHCPTAAVFVGYRLGAREPRCLFVWIADAAKGNLMASVLEKHLIPPEI
ncbi:MAG: hypothetical protein ACLU9S_03495 [Oscillospiraceae bacterium]